MLRASLLDRHVLSWLHKLPAKNIQLQRLSKVINNVAGATVPLMTVC